jgi:chromosomal replication initiator protein
MTLDPLVKAEIADGAAITDNAPKLIDILNAVSSVYAIGKMDLVSFRRFPHLVEARDAFYWCARTMTPRSYPEIGQFFGNRDHSTVLTGVQRATKRFEKNRARLEKIAKRLGVELKEQTP